MLACIFILPCVLLYAFYKNKEDLLSVIKEEFYTVEEARSVAEVNLRAFESWKQPRVGQVYKFYNLDGQVSAYLFEVVDSIGRSGYLAVRSSRNEYPLIKVYIDEHSPIAVMQEVKNNLALYKNREPKDIESMGIYLGADEFYAKYVIREGDDVQEIIYLLDPIEPEEYTLEQIKQKDDFL